MIMRRHGIARLLRLVEKAVIDGRSLKAIAMNSLWLVITALAAFLVAYRFYGAFLAARVAVLERPERHPRPSAPRRHRLPAHAAAGAVWRPFRRDRRAGAAGRPGAGLAMGLFSRLLLDHHRRLPGGRGSRLRGAAGLGAARRHVAAEDRPRSARSDCRGSPPRWPRSS